LKTMQFVNIKSINLDNEWKNLATDSLLVYHHLSCLHAA
jgi:hypothetical protein